MATKLQIAMRRNILLRYGAEFLSRLCATLEVSQESFRLLSAEESFRIQELSKALLQGAQVHHDLSHSEVQKCVDQVNEICTSEQLVVFLGHHEEMPIEMNRELVFKNWFQLLDFDGDLMSVTSTDGTSSLVLDLTETGKVNVILRGMWRGIRPGDQG